MYKARAVGDTAGPGCSKGDGARTSAGMMDNADGPEKAEGKVDIIMPDQINKTPMLISY